MFLAVPIQANEFRGLTSWINSFKTPDFSQIKNTSQRKIAFFNYLLPIIEKENKKIRLLRVLIKNNRLNKIQINKLIKKYRLKKSTKKALLNAIDIIPNSMILAQAAIESNWGRSQFSKHWHNYFGIWCFKPGCGVVPKQRPENATHEIAIFSSASKSVEYYMLNINRHFAYTLLRKIRQYKRNNHLPITGIALSEGLGSYSGIGFDYVEQVQSIIKYNKLE
ncbi:MAG: BAX protein [Candidatus Ruthia sp. Asou_11_S2]|nr:BAX protein [Candidatus Ruthia sp. Asou_11_S2]